MGKKRIRRERKGERALLVMLVVVSQLVVS